MEPRKCYCGQPYELWTDSKNNIMLLCPDCTEFLTVEKTEQLDWSDFDPA